MYWDGSIRLQRAPFSQPLDVAPREALFALALICNSGLARVTHLICNLGLARATHLEVGVATREDQMKRWFTILAVTAIISAGVLAALTARPVAAADDEVVTADRAATVAFEKGDKAAINKWVDPEFTWIDTDGVMWMLREALESRLKPLVPSAGDIKVVLGGIIPEPDRKRLLALGVSAVFTPKDSNLGMIVARISDICADDSSTS